MPGQSLPFLSTKFQSNFTRTRQKIQGMCSHLTIAANKDDSDVLLFNDDQLCAISECTTIKTLFRIKLCHCWRWDDFSFLKAIVQAVGCPISESLLKQYVQKLDNTMKLQKIHEFCE